MELSQFKKWTSFFLVLLGAELFTVSAQAVFFVEPLVNYDSATNTADTVATTGTPSFDVSSKATGFSYGARLGYHFGIPMFIAAEYLGESENVKYNNSALNLPNTTATGTAVSALIGFHLNRFRFIFGYSPTDAFTVKGTNGGTDSKFTGSNVKVGIGIWLHRHVTLELDYVVPTYNKVDTGSGSVSTSTIYSKFDSNILRAGLTFPIFF